MIGVSRSTLWRMVQAGEFPSPVRITQRNSGYVLESVEEWMKARAEGLAWAPPTPAAVHSDSRKPAPTALTFPRATRRGHG